VVATLREATGLPPREFLKKLVIFGERGRYRSQCWFRAEGLNDRVLRGVAAAAFRQGAPTIYIPATRGTGTFYDRLILGEPVEGHYFSTPLDLSPALDERPFFEDVDRLAISPVGRAMPEERAPPAGPAPLVVIPPGDRGLAGVLLIGALAACAIVAVGSRISRVEGFGRSARGAAPGLALGACAGLALEAFAAWARWLAPSAASAQAAAAAVLLAAGIVWVRLDRSDRRNPSAWMLTLAAALSLAAVAAYRVPPALPAFGWLGSALALAAAGALAGALLGGSLHAALVDLDVGLAASGAWFWGFALVAASLAWPAGRLTATHFGYRSLWALAAVAALAAAGTLRRARCARPGEPPT
jgi:hypothetical protein